MQDYCSDDTASDVTASCPCVLPAAFCMRQCRTAPSQGNMPAAYCTMKCRTVYYSNTALPFDVSCNAVCINSPAALKTLHCRMMYHEMQYELIILLDLEH